MTIADESEGLAAVAVCPDCKFQIPKAAVKCGHCGCKLAGTTRQYLARIVLGAVGGLALGGTLLWGISHQINQDVEQDVNERCRLNFSESYCDHLLD